MRIGFCGDHACGDHCDQLIRFLQLFTKIWCNRRISGGDHSKPKAGFPRFFQRDELLRYEIRLCLARVGLFQVGPDGSRRVNQLKRKPPDDRIADKVRAAESYDVNRELEAPDTEILRFGHVPGLSTTYAVSVYARNRLRAAKSTQHSLRMIGAQMAVSARCRALLPSTISHLPSRDFEPRARRSRARGFQIACAP
jgi:hypothetical protein